jgi:hypothetical protein
MIEYKILKFFRVIFSSIQNTKFIAFSLWPLEAFFYLVFFFLKSKSKTENNYFFAKKNYVVFSFIMQNDRPKHKTFRMKGELIKHPHTYIVNNFK